MIFTEKIDKMKPKADSKISMTIIQNKISEIVKKSKKTYAFNQKFQSVSYYLNKKLFELQSMPEDKKEKIDQDILNKLSKKLDKYSKMINKIKDQKKFLAFCFSERPIEQFLNKIDKCMSEIIKLLKEIGLESTGFRQPHNYDDYTNISDLLIELQQTIQRRRKEVDISIKQNHEKLVQYDSAKDIDTDNREALDKIPEYKIDKKNLSFTPKVIYYNDVFQYFNGFFTNPEDSERQKVTVLQLEPIYKNKYKRLLDVLVKIDHPYVEKFIGSFIEDDGTVFIVTNRSGKNLKKFLQDEQKKAEKDINYQKTDRTILAFKIAEAMLYLHSRNVIHRNLTEENIFIQEIDENGYKEVNPMICGFRDSRFLPVNPTSYCQSTKDLAKIIDFSAPELSDPFYNEKIDVFAFSGILYKLITDESPKDKITKDSAYFNDQDWRTQWLKGLPKNIQNLVNSCWEQNPKKRFSFHQIITTMIKDSQNRPIIFPCDIKNLKSIKEFYKTRSISNPASITIIDSFENIKKDIAFAYQYRFEILKIRPIIHSYQSVFRSKYENKDQLSEEEDNIMKDLKDSIDKLSNTLKKSDYENWQEFKKQKFDQMTIDIQDQMISIYKNMESLGFEELKQYKVEVDDLVFDYRELMNFYSNDPGSEKKVSEIEEYFRSNWDKKMTSKVLNRRLTDLFAPFHSFKIEREEIKIGSKKVESEFSEVYKGTFTRYEEVKPVAIKIIKEEHFKHENELTFLRREMGYLVKLRHKNIPKFYGFSFTEKLENEKYNNDVWLISEWVPHGTLREMLDIAFGKSKDNTSDDKTSEDDVMYNELNANDRAKIAYQIAEAMQYIHSQNIIYLNLKSSNILLDGITPKIIDFGSARPYNDALEITRTKSGQIYYMSPEVQSGENCGKHSDIYSYSMLLWEMATGKVPLSGLDEDTIHYKIEIGVELDMAELDKDELGDNHSLKNIITKGTSNSPSDRFKSFDSILSLFKEERVTFPCGNYEDFDLINFYDNILPKPEAPVVKSDDEDVVQVTVVYESKA